AEEQAQLREQCTVVFTQIKQSLDTLSAYGASDVTAELALIREYTEAAIDAADQSTTADADSREPVQSEAQQANNDTHDSPTAVADPVVAQADSDADELTPAIAARISELNTVPFGTWFNLRNHAAHAPVRAKLSWYSRISGNYMFVDSMGIKIAVLKQQELAAQLATGQAEILREEEHPLIHRALEAIRRMLGSEQTAHA
ncbi:MAG: DUF1631 family protein, partial [Gammaproteobacteria bacterium]